jgi:hypothetical protein
VPTCFRKQTMNTPWVPLLLSFPTPSTPRRTLLIGFGSYKWLNPRFHGLLARWICSHKKSKDKGDGRSGVHIKAYFWSIGVHPSTLHSLSCSLQKKKDTKDFDGAGLSPKFIPPYPMVLLLCPGRSKSEEYTVDGTCCLTKNTTRELMSSAAFPCPTLSKRDQADGTKHCATTKDAHLCSMRETCARLPCKNENYSCASYMQTFGLTLHSPFGIREAHGDSGSLDLPAGTNVCCALHIKADFRGI